jgi:single-stranded DNA-specific DHH superfamily exonuclease
MVFAGFLCSAEDFRCTYGYGGSVLVVAGEDWHRGVIGVVASKVMEMYYRPAVLIALKDGHGRGSARSIPGVDLFACLTACGQHLEELGIAHPPSQHVNDPRTLLVRDRPPGPRRQR